VERVLALVQRVSRLPAGLRLHRAILIQTDFFV
jgi:hypothetical protein